MSMILMRKFQPGVFNPYNCALTVRSYRTKRIIKCHEPQKLSMQGKVKAGQEEEGRKERVKVQPLELSENFKDTRDLWGDII